MLSTNTTRQCFCTTLIHNVEQDATSAELMRAKLIRHLNIERGSNNRPIDISKFNLRGVDLKDINLRGIDFSSASFVGAVLGKDNLEVIMANEGNLCGATLAPGIYISGMTFDFIKVDKTMLGSLIAAGANVRGVDLSGQNLTSMDLSNVDLSHANCTGTNLTHTTLIKTNFTGATFDQTQLNFAVITGSDFTGVDLGNASLTYTKGDFVIVSAPDRAPYVNLYKNRLRFILSGERNGDDPFYGLTEERTSKMRKQIQFSPRENSFQYGETSKDGGCQDMALQRDSDRRNFNFNTMAQEDKNKSINDAVQKLLGDGFSPEQKTLFHHARSAIWNIPAFDAYMELERILDDVELMDRQLLFTTYINGEKNGSTLAPEMMEACFDAVLPEFKQRYPAIAEGEIRAVRELFMSANYRW